MPFSFWRSSEAMEQLNRLDRAGFAVEFLRRNAGYRRDYARSIVRSLEASIRMPRGSGSPAVGGCPFVHDPDLPATRATVLWRPEVSPGTMIIAPAPPGYEGLPPIDPAQLRPILADREGIDGRSVIIGDPSGNIIFGCRTVQAPGGRP